MSDLFDAYLYNRSVAIGLESSALLFFVALTAYSLVRGKRAYLPGLLIVDFGILNALVRTLFFFQLSSHPARPGGIWRLATGAIVVWGWVLIERVLRRERKVQKG